jgi:AAA domain
MPSPDRQTADETACAFLALILPEQGPYAAFIAKRKYNRFASTIEELGEIIKVEDAAGHTVYHACAAYKEARHDPKGTPRAQRRYGRTQHNASCAKSFWLDVDAGPDKPYANWEAAAQAVATFCRATGLPTPLIVLSGLGIHVYWPLKEAVGPDTWERYARGLRSLCVEQGLHVDPTRTTDISSVLRTPGTHHRKEGVREVQCGPLVGPFELSTFDILLEYSEEHASRRSNKTIVELLGEPPEYLDLRPPRNVTKDALAGLKDFEPAYSELVAEHCEQVRELRDKQGNLQEPLWYAALGVLVFCKDGEKFAHEWSGGDERYTLEETGEKLDRARQLSGATTCRRFHELNHEPCERCPWWGKIKSPIVLGRQQTQSRCDSTGGAAEEIPHKEGQQDQTHQQGQHEQTNQQEKADQTGQQGDNGQQNKGTAQSAFPLRWHGDEDPNINRKWLIKHLLSTTGVGLISGQWGAAKTFVAIDLSISVMTGNPFAGRAVKRKGGVLFIAAEGASEIPIRVNGLIETKLPGHKGKLPFAWAENCPTLTGQGAIEQLVQIAREAADRMKAEFVADLVLIIVDTMSATAGFKDENASSEGQLAMNVLNDLSKRTGALVMACDHFGKAIETGTRGTSAKEASADIIIACLGDKTPAGNVTNLRIAVRKLRGGATGAETAFRLRTIDMGVDEDGDPITTCVIEWSRVTVAAPPEAAKGKNWPRSTIRFRAALVTTLTLHATEQRPDSGGATVFAVELDQLRAEFDRRYPIDGHNREKQLASRRQAFKRSMNTAELKGLIGSRDVGGKFMVWLTRPEEEGVIRPGAPSGQRAA